MIKPELSSSQRDEPPVIEVCSISKSYRIWRDPAARLKLPIIRTAASILPNIFITKSLRVRLGDEAGAPYYYRNFFALHDVSLEVRRGETMGIIGRNGSGKSTLLQIIASTLTPSSGTASVRGRVAALLELGSGFNPEFTGRENVYLNAGILGLTHKETDDRFSAIAAFADIGEFIDQPTKIYSSGMMMRLAFAVQAMVDPEILIVDEALAVGDEPFQRKCFSKIESLKKAGTTILFVSHDASAITQLCDRAILLDAGRVVATGHPREIIKTYQRLLHSRECSASARTTPEHAKIEKSADAYDPSLKSLSQEHYICDTCVLHNWSLLDEDGLAVNILRSGGNYRIVYRASFAAPHIRVRFGTSIKNIKGLVITGCLSSKSSDSISTTQPAEYMISYDFRCLLLPGSYFLTIGIFHQTDAGEKYLTRVVDAMMFNVRSIEPELTSTELVELITPSLITHL